jgi:hypothetical protein
MNQFEIWRAKPEGFPRAHYFVIISGQERCEDARTQQYNALACFTLRGNPTKLDVVLNGADGLDCRTACQCDFLYVLPKASLLERKGSVSFERRQQIKEHIRNILRLN